MTRHATNNINGGQLITKFLKAATILVVFEPVIMQV